MALCVPKSIFDANFLLFFPTTSGFGDIFFIFVVVVVVFKFVL